MQTGLTETCARTFVLLPNEMEMPGTVGPPVPNVDVRLESLPETERNLCRGGKTIFSGYYKREDLTKEGEYVAVYNLENIFDQVSCIESVSPENPIPSNACGSVAGMEFERPTAAPLNFAMTYEASMSVFVWLTSPMAFRLHFLFFLFAISFVAFLLSVPMDFERPTAAPLNSAMSYDEASMV
ncbi:hypothetical protein V8G54_032613 [Vigna mungo]|uniref:Uncharacterized protein n=1 Tax=Vigna mungo TaxID=3915 RepID=A0AAQ3MME7_VIGMU